MSEKCNKIQFIIGIALALIGSILMFFDILPLSARITLGIIGLALIATSRHKKKLSLKKEKASYENIDFSNFRKIDLSKFDKLTKKIENNFLIITAVDGSIDSYLENKLNFQNIHFDSFEEKLLVYPESSRAFIDYIKNIPECSFFCCKVKPSFEKIEKIKKGYREEISLELKTDLLKNIFDEMKTLDSFLYVSQGDCNLLIASGKSFF